MTKVYDRTCRGRRPRRSGKSIRVYPPQLESCVDERDSTHLEMSSLIHTLVLKPSDLCIDF